MNTQTTKTNVVTVSDSNFTDVILNSDRPVVVDFHGDWKPQWLGVSENVREEIVTTYEGRIILAEVNTTLSRKIAAAYGIGRIPNVFVFFRGNVIYEFVGTVEIKTLVAAIDDVITIEERSNS